MQKANLVSMPTLVESPFIIAEIGGYTFGTAPTGSFKDSGAHLNVDFPNYMKSLSIIKVNGTVNTYTLNFSYQVAIGQDPNLLSAIFSKASKDRKIKLSYGDWMAPSYTYKEEKAIITQVTESLNMESACIDYTVKCTSDAIGLTSSTFSFPAIEAKPSDVIKNMVSNLRYGFKQVFTGMQSNDKVLSNNLIASNDKVVKLNAQRDITPLDYLNYLVDSMIDTKVPEDNGIHDSAYYLTIHDDVSNNLGGTYFKVTEVSAKPNIDSATDTYELDVNYPTTNYITQFSLNNDQSWAILYEYSNDISQDNYSYKIDDDGKLVATKAPKLLRSQVTGEVAAAASSWWSKMTSFPIQATLTLKGLTRPSILMSYVKLNVWFTGGLKHISSGKYIITKQEDKIDSSGFKTTLTLLRIGGDS